MGQTFLDHKFKNNWLQNIKTFVNTKISYIHILSNFSHYGAL